MKTILPALLMSASALAAYEACGENLPVCCTVTSGRVRSCQARGLPFRMGVWLAANEIKRSFD